MVHFIMKHMTCEGMKTHWSFHTSRRIVPWAKDSRWVMVSPPSGIVSDWYISIFNGLMTFGYIRYIYNIYILSCAWDDLALSSFAVAHLSSWDFSRSCTSQANDNHPSWTHELLFHTTISIYFVYAMVIKHDNGKSPNSRWHSHGKLLFL